MFKKAKKRAITLVEMMIVMFLIAMITGVIAYNYSGSLEEGKAFKTKAGKEKIETILSLYQAQHPGEDIQGTWQEIVKRSPMAKDGASLINDGWGVEYKVDIHESNIEVTSSRYTQYEANKKSKH